MLTVYCIVDGGEEDKESDEERNTMTSCMLSLAFSQMDLHGQKSVLVTAYPWRPHFWETDWTVDTSKIQTHGGVTPNDPKLPGKTGPIH